MHCGNVVSLSLSLQATILLMTLAFGFKMSSSALACSSSFWNSSASIPGVALNSSQLGAPRRVAFLSQISSIDSSKPTFLYSQEPSRASPLSLLFYRCKIATLHTGILILVIVSLTKQADL